MYDRDCCDAHFLSTLADKELSPTDLQLDGVFWLKPWK